jgi:hypothetical protein
MITSRRSDLRCTQLYSESTLSLVVAATSGRVGSKMLGECWGNLWAFVVARGGVGASRQVLAIHAFVP